jgi:hypothetical protein
MNETTATGSKVRDMDGFEALQWGETEEDVRYVESVVTRISQAGERASVAGEYARDYAELVMDLRGAATMMGVAIPVGEDVVATVRSFLLASRDHEGEVSENIIRAAHGKSEDERRAARRYASQFSGRRGVLDSAVYWLDRGTKALAELRAWEERAR